MSKLKQWFDQLGYSEIYEKLNSDEEDVKVADLVKSFKSEQKDIHKSMFADEFSGISKEKEQEIYKKQRNSLFQKFKSTLGLTEVGNVKDYDDEGEFLKAVKSEVESRSKQGDNELKAKYEEIVNKYNDSITQIEQRDEKINELNNNFETFKSDFEYKLNTRNLFNREFDNLQFGVSKSVVQDYKKWWSDDILNNVKVTDFEKGIITKKDGTAVLDPDTNRRIDTLGEYLAMRVDKRGIGKKSNGEPDGGGDDDFIPGGGSDLERAKKREIAQKAKERGIDTSKGSDVATFLENIKTKQSEKA